ATSPAPRFPCGRSGDLAPRARERGGAAPSRETARYLVRGPPACVSVLPLQKQSAGQGAPPINHTQPPPVGDDRSEKIRVSPGLEHAPTTRQCMDAGDRGAD